MFKFNDIIEDFIKTSKDDEREQFFPIILWWKISTIIPLRSHEIVLIPLSAPIFTHVAISLPHAKSKC